MQVLGGRSTKLAQSLLNSVHEACHEWLTDRRRRNRQLTIGWVSRHDGVEGNECADNEAKIAVQEGSSPEDELPEALQGSSLRSSLCPGWRIQGNAMGQMEIFMGEIPPKGVNG